MVRCRCSLAVGAESPGTRLSAAAVSALAVHSLSRGGRFTSIRRWHALAALHIINRVHEPEAHELLNAVFDSLGTVEALVIDVGANGGALVLGVSRRLNAAVVGYEPAEACVSAILKTLERNGRYNVSAFRDLVGGSRRTSLIH
jgi:hypothetical protein